MAGIRLRTSRRTRGATLIEVVVGALIVTVSALGLFCTFGVQRGNTLRASHKLQALALVQGREEELLGDLSRGADSPLYAAAAKDFTLRYLIASGNPASPWTLSTSQATEALTLGTIGGFQLKTTVQYLDDSLDGTSPSDTDPYDALKINVSIVPVNVGDPNPYGMVAVETLWYR